MRVCVVCACVCSPHQEEVVVGPDLGPALARVPDTTDHREGDGQFHNELGSAAPRRAVVVVAVEEYAG